MNDCLYCCSHNVHNCDFNASLVVQFLINSQITEEKRSRWWTGEDTYETESVKEIDRGRQACVCLCEREWVRQRAKGHKCVREWDGSSDCHLAFDRRGQSPSWGHARHNLSTELYQSVNSEGRKTGWRFNKKEKLRSKASPLMQKRDFNVKLSVLC